MAVFETVHERGVAVLVVEGKLGLESLRRFEEHLAALLETVDGADPLAPDACVVDLAACPYMSSRTFPPLLKATEALAARGGRLFVATNPGLSEILSILRLDRRLGLYPSRRDCLLAASELGG